MSAIDGLLTEKVDPSYDWTTFGDDYWESLGKDDGDLEHYYEKGSCYEQKDGGIWWLHRYGISGQYFVYLICFSTEGSDRIIVPTMRTLSDPKREFLEPPQFKQMIGRLHGEDLENALEYGVGLSKFDEVFPHAKLWGSAHSHWNSPPYVLYGASIMSGAEIEQADTAAKVQPKNHVGKSESGGWLKRIFGSSPKSRNMLDEVEDKGSKLIVQGYRRIAAQNGWAPTSKTSDAEIVEIYKKVGTIFRQIAKERQEHLAAGSLNYIVLKFFQVRENFGAEMFDQHLEYEVQKYRSEGLRPDYDQSIQLF